MRFNFFLIFWCVLLGSGSARSEVGLVARGGPIIEQHFNSLSNFDPDVRGNPIVVGGMGYGQLSKSFRVGGGGGGGFLLNGSENVELALGYGGAVIEYTIVSWLNARILLGGGGYAIQKVISESISERLIRRVASGGFFLVNPSINAEIRLNQWTKLVIGLGYFFPTVAKLQGGTLNFNLQFGKS